MQPKSIPAKRRLMVDNRLGRKAAMLVVLLLVGAVGLSLVAVSEAATYTVGEEAEAGALSSSSTRITSNKASGGTAVRFGASLQLPLPPSVGGNEIAVSTAAQLTSALASAKPGDTIVMRDGTYSGRFNSTRSATAQAPITLTGSRNAIIDGGSLGSGYTFSLGTKNSNSSVSHWRLVGFSLTGGQKGIMFDNVQKSIIDNVSVRNIGHEGVHLRNFSSNNTVQNTTITKTGQNDQRYGEGVYVGTAQSNWDTFSQGKPDRSDGNQLLKNTISYTGAESIDIKEGTHGGIIHGNTLDGRGMCYDTSADCNFADSLVDMKGEGWTIAANSASKVRVTWKGSGVESDAFQVHVISQGASEGSGNNNSFMDNKIDDVAGYGFNIQTKATGVIVDCNNTVTNAGKGFGNVTCKE